MSFISIEDRLNALERLLDELRELNRTIPIIVEGRSDVQSLERLGFNGTILPLNIGKSILAFCEDYAREHPTVIVLMDWDPRGRRLQADLGATMKLVAVEVEDEFWLELRRLVQPDIKDVESLAALVGRLREQKHAASTPALR